MKQKVENMNKKLRKNSLKSTATVVIVLVLLSLVTGFPKAFSQVGKFGKTDSLNSEKKNKISKDLLDESKSPKTVSIMVQMENHESSELNKFLKNKNVRVKESFANIGAQTIELLANQVEKLADFSEVTYVSKNRDLRSLDHLEKTTSAAAMRAERRQQL